MRAAGGAVQRYVAGAVPSSPEDLSAFLREELAKLQSAYNALADGQLDLTTVAPAKPRDGMTRYAAAGVLGALAGMYSYYGGAWHFADSGVERGSNANGDYVRFPDGTQICSIQLGATSVVASAMTRIDWVFPAVFVGGSPVVVFGDGEPQTSEDCFGISRTYATANPLTSAAFGYRNGATAQTILRIMAQATGRWY